MMIKNTLADSRASTKIAAVSIFLNFRKIETAVFFADTAVVTLLSGI